MNRQNLTREQCWKIAEMMAEDRLTVVNQLSKPIKPRSSFYGKYIKRLIDIVVSLIALVLTSPINLVIGCITLFDVGRPIFFFQERSGKDGKPFHIVKFRNMHNTRDERGELLPPAQRVTKWGLFVRKTSLDELLNFWSILKGDMSLIGPRALPVQYLGRYSDRHRQRLAVRPGLECPPHERLDHVWSWQERFENDVWYVENISFRTDCMMLVRLVQLALDRKTAKARAEVKMGAFMGYDYDGNVLNSHQIPEEYLSRILGDQYEGVPAH